ncbi:MAG: transcription termination factor Rho, partial [Candidatus Marinimicrobia bacterium]|nr:transcription termination factor Rho [Candidatus Neomarinimicrobiota bacterium]
MEVSQRLDIDDLQSMNIKELTKMAQDLQIPGYSGLKKQNLIFKILEAQAEQEGLIFSKGVLEILEDGYGFLRSPDYNYTPGPDDIYISPSQIKRFGLQTGHVVSGQIRPPKDDERFFALLRVEAVNFQRPDEIKRTVMFDNLTPLYPDERFQLEHDDKDYSTRIVDLISPIG